jgi:autoinducer 2 (AI-2) kinase
MLFDFRDRDWSQEIIDAFAIDRDALPPIAAPGASVGTLSPQVALELGLPAGTAVHAGGADTQCGLLGVGAIEPGDVAVTLGTTSPVQAVFDRPRLDPSETLWAGCHVVKDRWVLESNAGSSGDAYEWLLDLLVGAESDRYQRAEELMAGEAPGGQVASFIGPRVFDLSKIRPDLPGAFLFPFPSLQLRPNAGQLLRSFLESLACAVRGNIEQLSAATGEKPHRLRVGGGLSRSRLLVQMVADVTGLPVDLGTVSDATSLGAAILAFTGAGEFPNLHAAVDAMSDCETIEPNPSAPAIAPETYDRWRRLCESVDQLTV